MRTAHLKPLLLVTILLHNVVNGDPSTAAEQRQLSIGGSLRLRLEWKDDFDFASSVQDYALSQLRVNAAWDASERLSVFAEVQDARVLGESKTAAPPVNEDVVPNIFADELDLHQGFVDFTFSAQQFPARLRIGRQKFNLGAQRLIASLEWVNTARVWDGVRLTLGSAKSRTLDVIASRLVPVDPNHPNDYDRTGSRLFNSSFYALYYTDSVSFDGSRFEAYLLLRNESDVEDAVYTIGTRLDTRNSGNVELAAQTGEYGGADHRGLAFHLGTGYRVPELANTRFGAAYNFGTGDGDTTDGDHWTFDNQYPLNHAYYGFMDFFSLQNMHNVEATAKTQLSGTALRLAYQGFWIDEPEADAWYNAGAGVIRGPLPGDGSSFAGSEIDVTATRKYGNLALQAGYSHFFPGAYVEDSGPSADADFFYLMQKLKL